ncbi:hypothetical protein U1Q18_014333 [Sarracenia purpurea var. burkii]
MVHLPTSGLDPWTGLAGRALDRVCRLAGLPIYDRDPWVLLNLADLADKVDFRPRPRTGLERSFESQGSVAGIPFLGLSGELAPRRRDSRDGDSGLPTNRQRALTVGRKWRRESQRTESSRSWWRIHDSGISSPRLNFRAGGLNSG